MNIWPKFLLTKSKSAKIRVCHGYRDEVGGPFVKLERMNRYFPNHKKDFNVVYGVSGTNLPQKVLDRARRKKFPVVCHMNSCWHPAYADDFDEKNHLLKVLHNEYADFVVYGSHQAMEGAKRYLGSINPKHRMIYNAVDTKHFTPGVKAGLRPQVLAAGLHQFTHRLKPLILAMPQIAKAVPDVELVIAGSLVEGDGIYDCGRATVEEIVRRSGFSNIRYIDSYTQQEAPEIYRQADVLVHLKHMDWTPNVVAEAMACGLPIVHTGNGGVPEIVDDAGVSLEITVDWDKIREADPDEVAAAVVSSLGQQKRLSCRAREIAETRFNLNEWIREHREIFSELLHLS
jgi:glycosyltransferase involved in cell wall biosynthesis